MTERINAIEAMEFDDEIVHKHPELEVGLEFEAVKRMIKEMQRAHRSFDHLPHSEKRAVLARRMVHMSELLMAVRQEMETMGVSAFSEMPSLVRPRRVAKYDFLDEYTDFAPMPKRRTQAEEDAFMQEFSETIPPIPRQTDDYIDNPLAWQADAACLYTDPEIFFPEKGGVGVTPAKKICATCEVKAECLEYAVVNVERFGVWGGKSERERRKIINVRQAKREAKEAEEKKRRRERRIVTQLAKKAGQSL